MERIKTVRVLFEKNAMEIYWNFSSNKLALRVLNFIIAFHFK